MIEIKAACEILSDESIQQAFDFDAIHGILCERHATMDSLGVGGGVADSALTLHVDLIATGALPPQDSLHIE